MINFKKTFKTILILSAIVGFQNFFSQDSTSQSANSKKWHFLVEPYLLFPNMNGIAGVGSLPDVNVVANPGDIFSRL